MSVEDVFSIWVVALLLGRIERASRNSTIKLRLSVSRTPPLPTVVTGIEMFRKLLDSGQAGDNVGILLRGVDKDSIERGQVLAARNPSPRTRRPRPKFTCSARMRAVVTRLSLTVSPTTFRTTDVTGVVNLPEGVEMVMPGDNVSVEIELIYPCAMEKTQLRHSWLAAPSVPAVSPTSSNKLF